jgi:hypothetical protein
MAAPKKKLLRLRLLRHGSCPLDLYLMRFMNAINK